MQYSKSVYISILLQQCVEGLSLFFLLCFQVNRSLATALMIITVACLWIRFTMFNDPSEGNVFLQQLREKEKLERLKASEKASASNGDPKS